MKSTITIEYVRTDFVQITSQVLLELKQDVVTPQEFWQYYIVITEAKRGFSIMDYIKSKNKITSKKELKIAQILVNFLGNDYLNCHASKSSLKAKEKQ